MIKKFAWVMAIVMALFMVSNGDVFAKELINGIDANFHHLPMWTKQEIPVALILNR